MSDFQNMLDQLNSAEQIPEQPQAEEITEEVPETPSTEIENLSDEDFARVERIAIEEETQFEYQGLLDASFSEYNSIGAMVQTRKAREALGYTKADVNAPAPMGWSVDPSMYRDLPEQYHAEIIHANNQKDAEVKRRRIEQSIANLRGLSEEGLFGQLSSGLLAGATDPLSYVGGALVGKGGQIAARHSPRLARLATQAEQGGRVSRTALRASQGAAIGAGGAVAPVGARMALGDPSANLTTLKQETLGGVVGGAALPIAGGAVGGALGGLSRRIRPSVLSPDFVGPLRPGEGYPVAPLGPVGRAITWAADNTAMKSLFHTANAIGGDSVYSVAHKRHPSVARSLFEDPVGTGGRQARTHNAELQKINEYNNLKTMTDYNFHLNRHINETHARLNPKKHFQQWTNSRSKKEFENLTYQRMLEIEAGLPYDATRTPTHIEEAAQAFHRANQHAQTIMVREEVTGAGVLQAQNQVTPRRFNYEKVNEAVTEIMNTQGLTRAAAENILTGRLAAVMKSNLSGAPGKHLRDLLEGLPAEQKEYLLMLLSRTLSETFITRGLNRPAGVQRSQDISNAINRVVKDFRFEQVALPESVQRAVLDFSNQRTPVGTHPISGMALKASNVEDIQFLRSLFDDNLDVLMQQHHHAAAGQNALARAGYKDKGQWDTAVEGWKRDAKEADNPYPIEYWEDYRRVLMGQPALRGVKNAPGDLIRRGTVGAAQSQLKKAGLSMISDLGNVISRGVYAQWQTFFAQPARTLGSYAVPKNWKNKVRKGEMLADMETLMGELIDPHRLNRGDTMVEEFSLQGSRQAKSLFQDPSGAIGRGVDHTQAMHNRYLGMYSGMNQVNAWTNLVGTKTLINEIRKGVQGKTPNPLADRRLVDMGLDPANMNLIRPMFDKYVDFGKFGGVKNLNLAKWRIREREVLMQAVNRGLRQINGEATMGELPDRLRNPYMRVAMQHRTFTLAAHEKAHKRGVQLGAAHYWGTLSATMGLGLATVWMQELVRSGGDIDAANELFTTEGERDYVPVGVRRAISTTPHLGGTADSLTALWSPVIAFADTDMANAMHFGYNRYDWGPPRGGLDRWLDEIPLLSFAGDVTKSGASTGRAAGAWINDEKPNFQLMFEDIINVAPAGPGTALSSLLMLESVQEFLE